MEELMIKIDNLILALEEQEEVKEIKRLNKKLEKDKELKALIEEK